MEKLKASTMEGQEGFKVDHQWIKRADKLH
jgi:hypothetical protein